MRSYESNTAERPDAPGRNKTTPAWVFAGWLDQTGYSFVERQQDASFPKRRGHDDRIGRSRQVLVEDCVGVVAGLMQIRDEIDGKVLIDLEFHRACKGISRSSCANSAAYARAASMCSTRRVG